MLTILWDLQSLLGVYVEHLDSACEEADRGRNGRVEGGFVDVDALRRSFSLRRLFEVSLWKFCGR